MKKVISVLLALMMVVSLGVVAIAANEPFPGEKIDVAEIANQGPYLKADWKIKDVDFTTKAFCGAGLVEDVELGKNGEVYLTIKEFFMLDEDKEIYGEIVLSHKRDKVDNGNGKMVALTETITVDLLVNNIVEEVYGESKAEDAEDISEYMYENCLMVNEDGGYVYFEDGVLTATVKMNKNEKVQAYAEIVDEDTQDAIDAYLGDDYKAIIEYYNYAGTGFDNKISFKYEADKEDPHFFYQWDGKKFVELDVEFDDDEDVEAYVWVGDINNVIIVTDEAIKAVPVEDKDEPEHATKNPDTGANDVVGVASALAVVSLVAAGAISLKK